MLFETTAAASFPVRLEADYPERPSRTGRLERKFSARRRVKVSLCVWTKGG